MRKEDVMRTLLVDNYDSFTYNLFHYLAEVGDEEPVVVMNDDPAFRLDLLDEFDNVVLSPGPGSPDRPSDFGICADIIRSARVPVLGVCLGHQGLAHVHGPTVRRAAAEPRHGRISAVRHDGTGLFTGLPSPLEVVRCHSLAVTNLPPELVASAWSPDGVVMALEHRDLPQWSVQFHPESIGTLGGHKMLANFARLTEEHHARLGRWRKLATVPPIVAPQPAAGAPPPRRRLRVLAQQLITYWDPEVLFDRLFRPGDHAYWLDSSQVGGQLGEFSIMGDASGPLARVAEGDVTHGTVRVTGGDQAGVVGGSIFDWLDDDLRSLDVETPELPCEFALGWVGYLGYELKADCGGVAAHRSATPDAVLVFADRAIVLDHRTDTTYLLALAEVGDETTARAWLRDTAVTLADLAWVQPAACPAFTPVPADRLRLRHGRKEYLDHIDTCQQEINAGETDEVCLTNVVTVEADISPWRAYRFLRRTSPAPFAAYLSFADVSVLSTSPQRFLRVDRTGVLESEPIQGTRAGRRTPAEVSTVRAEPRDGGSAVAGVRAAFPPGSINGAPKVRTMQVIDRLEAGARGVYSGAIGYFSLSGTADFSVVIRTLVMSGCHLTYGVGGAIIALSDPEQEYEEIAVEATPLLRLLGAEFPDRTSMPMVSGRSE
jgi:para-aminobenzoate synthetase